MYWLLTLPLTRFLGTPLPSRASAEARRIRLAPCVMASSTSHCWRAGSPCAFWTIT
jgi:hypothetical protein